MTSQWFGEGFGGVEDEREEARGELNRRTGLNTVAHTHKKRQAPFLGDLKPRLLGS